MEVEVQEQTDAVTETTTGTAAEQQPAQQPDLMAAQFQQQAEQMGMLTLQLMQWREQLADKLREHGILGAEIEQLELNIERDDRTLLRVQGAVATLKQLMQMQGDGHVE